MPRHTYATPVTRSRAASTARGGRVVSNARGRSRTRALSSPGTRGRSRSRSINNHNNNNNNNDDDNNNNQVIAAPLMEEMVATITDQVLSRVEARLSTINSQARSRATSGPTSPIPCTAAAGAVGSVPSGTMETVPHWSVGSDPSAEDPLNQRPCSHAQASTDAANSALQAILGRPPPSATYSNARSIAPLSSPLGVHVASHTREKIARNEFVELAFLLPKYAHFDLASDGAQPKQSKIPPLSSADFATAFHTLIALRCVLHPTEAPGMLKHLETCQDIERLFGQDTRTFYDSRVRQDMQYNANITWGSIHHEFYMQATAMGVVSLTTKNNSTRTPAPIGLKHKLSLRADTCWTFQLTGTCSKPNCNYPDTHKCYTCQGPHATSKCPRPLQSPVSQPAFRGSKPQHKANKQAAPFIKMPNTQ